MIKTVFMGSPAFALPTLQALLDAPDVEVVGVVTQPDRPAGRGNQLKMLPVKELALAHGLEVYQPEHLRGAAALDRLKAWAADLHIVTAYGQILRQNILDVPRFGNLNVHASLLPRWRGAAPIQAAIRAGDPESGVTIMLIDAGLDTGPMLLKAAIPLAPRETGQTLHDKLAALGGQTIVPAMRDYLAGKLTPQPQDNSLATIAGRIEKEEGRIDWSQSALAIDRHVRAFMPAPGTFTTWGGKLLKISAGEPLAGSLPPGQVAKGDFPLVIGTGEGLFAPTELQLEGKKRLPAQDFLNGNTEIIGAVLGK